MSLGRLITSFGWASVAGRLIDNMAGRVGRVARARRLRSRVRSGRLTTLAQAHLRDGEVQVEGRAMPVGLIEAPASGEMVIGYRLRVCLIEPDDIEWITVVDVSSFEDFEVHDATGRALVKAGRPLFLGQTAPRGRKELGTDLSRSLFQRRLALAGVSTTTLITARYIRYWEYTLRPEGIVLVHDLVLVDGTDAGAELRQILDQPRELRRDVRHRDLSNRRWLLPRCGAACSCGSRSPP